MKKIITILILTLPQLSNAQNNIEKKPTNTWFLLHNQYSINKQWSITNETHLRFADILKDRATFILRPSINYTLNESAIISLGYSYLNNKPQISSPYYGLKLEENNMWLQALLKQKVGKVELLHRFRQEFRWWDNVAMIDSIYKISGTNYGNRFRYRLTANIPIYRIKEQKMLYIAAFDEIWLTQNTTFLPVALTRNWLYAGFGFKMNKHYNLQMGLMHQWDPQGNNKFLSTPIIQTSLFHTF